MMPTGRTALRSAPLGYVVMVRLARTNGLNARGLLQGACVGLVDHVLVGCDVDFHAAVLRASGSSVV